MPDLGNNIRALLVKDEAGETLILHDTESGDAVSLPSGSIMKLRGMLVGDVELYDMVGRLGLRLSQNYAILQNAAEAELALRTSLSAAVEYFSDNVREGDPIPFWLGDAVAALSSTKGQTSGGRMDE